MQKIRIAHLTTVHPRADTRIRVRELGSLADAFAEPVALLVQDGKGSCVAGDGRIRIIDTAPRPAGRLARMTVGVLRTGRAVRALRPQIVHFHDPELIPLGLALKCLGYRVIHDAHEDLPRQALTKYWIPAIARKPVSWATAAIEWLAAQSLDAIVAAEPKIAGRFPTRKTTLVRNFPIPDELVKGDSPPYRQRPPHFAYIGGLTALRGIHEMLAALSHARAWQGQEIRLWLAGACQPASLLAEMQAAPDWQRVCFQGWADRERVAEILGKVRGGLVLLHPTPKYLEAYPTKMFEYMSAGLPVIVSDFPVWRDIVVRAGCGLPVNPLDPRAIADAMQWLLDHPAEAEAMGRRGREAVEQRYNWATEAEQLIALYEKLLKEP